MLKYPNPEYPATYRIPDPNIPISAETPLSEYLNNRLNNIHTRFAKLNFSCNNHSEYPHPRIITALIRMVIE